MDTEELCYAVIFFLSTQKAFQVRLHEMLLCEVEVSYLSDLSLALSFNWEKECKKLKKWISSKDANANTEVCHIKAKMVLFSFQKHPTYFQLTHKYCKHTDI